MCGESAVGQGLGLWRLGPQHSKGKETRSLSSALTHSVGWNYGLHWSPREGQRCVSFKQETGPAFPWPCEVPWAISDICGRQQTDRQPLLGVSIYYCMPWLGSRIKLANHVSKQGNNGKMDVRHAQIIAPSDPYQGRALCSGHRNRDLIYLYPNSYSNLTSSSVNYLPLHSLMANPRDHLYVSGRYPEPGRLPDSQTTQSPGQRHNSCQT